MRQNNQRIPLGVTEQMINDARNLGFTAALAETPIENIEEETQEEVTAIADVDQVKEIEENTPVENIEEEIGDLLFVVLNLARKLDVDAETALKRTNRKFRQRFAYIEKTLKADGKTLEDSNLAEMDALWNEAKKS